MGENILYLWRLDRQFLQNLQKQTTGTVFTNFSSSLTIPGGEEELLLPLRQLILKHIISTYPPKGYRYFLRKAHIDNRGEKVQRRTLDQYFGKCYNLDDAVDMGPGWESTLLPKMAALPRWRRMPIRLQRWEMASPSSCSVCLARAAPSFFS